METLGIIQTLTDTKGTLIQLVQPASNPINPSTSVHNAILYYIIQDCYTMILPYSVNIATLCFVVFC